MQRTDSIFFISGKQICGKLSLNLLSQAQVTRNEIGEILGVLRKLRPSKTKT